MGSSVLSWVFKGPWDFTFLYWFCLYTASYTIFLFLLIVCQWVLGIWSHQAKELAFIFLTYYVPNSPSPAYLLVGVCVGHKPMLLFSSASQFYFVRQGISLTQESTFGIHWLSREPLRSTYVWCTVLWLPVYVTRPSFFMSFGAQNSCAHSYTERVSPT